MKNLMKVSLVAIAMSATSVWADIFPTSLYEVPVSEEALIIANTINSEPVKECLQQVQDRFRGDIVIERISQRNPHDLRKFIIQVAVLVGGDAFVGSAEILVQRTVGIPWGVHYQCQVLMPTPMRPPHEPTNPVVNPIFENL